MLSTFLSYGSRFGMLHATDKRDLIYGLLGVASDYDPEAENNLRITIDYTKTVKQVFIEASSAILLNGHMELLVVALYQHQASLQQGHSNLTELPSWAIRWDKVVEIPSWSILSDHKKSDNDGRFVVARLSASVKVIDLQQGLLSSRGAKICTIAHVHRPTLHIPFAWMRQVEVFGEPLPKSSILLEGQMHIVLFLDSARAFTADLLGSSTAMSNCQSDGFYSFAQLTPGTAFELRGAQTVFLKFNRSHRKDGFSAWCYYMEILDIVRDIVLQCIELLLLVTFEYGDSDILDWFITRRNRLEEEILAHQPEVESSSQGEEQNSSREHCPAEIVMENLRAGFQIFDELVGDPADDSALSQAPTISLPRPIEEVVGSHNRDPKRFWGLASSRLFHLAMKEVIWKAETGTGGTGYVGLGSPNIRPREVVCVLYGAETPFILRPRGDGTYCLFGEAYVQGIIDREAYEEGISVKGWGKLEEEDFVLA